MKADIESALEDCIARIRSGEGIEACLQSYPEHAADLRTMIAASLEISSVEVTPPYLAMARGRRRYFQAATARRGRHNRRFLWFPLRYTRQLAAAVAGVVLIALTGSAILAYQGWQARPGDNLYDVRLWLEEARLSSPLASDDEKAGLLVGYVDRRYSEYEEALSSGQPVDAALLGRLRGNVEDLLAVLPEDGESGRKADVAQLASRGENLLIHSSDFVASADNGLFVSTLLTIHAARLYESDAQAARAYLQRSNDFRGVTRVVGPLSRLGDQVALGGIGMTVDDGSVILATREEGQTAVATAAWSRDGSLHVLTLSGDSGDREQDVFVSGQVESYLNRILTINGQRVQVTTDSIVVGAIRLGSPVEVTARRDRQGLLVADVARIKDDSHVNSFVYEGPLEAVESADDGMHWQVGGQRFTTSSLTLIDSRLAPLAVGAYTRIEATTQQGQLSARRLHVISSPQDEQSVRLRGRIESVGEDNVVFVNGIPVRYDLLYRLQLANGSPAEIVGHWDGQYLIPRTAQFLDSGPDARFVVEGVVTAIGDGGIFHIGSFAYRVDQDTVLTGTVAVGARVSVQSVVDAEGTVLAVRVDVLRNAPKPVEGDSSLPGGSSGPQRQPARVGGVS